MTLEGGTGLTTLGCCEKLPESCRVLAVMPWIWGIRRMRCHLQVTEKTGNLSVSRPLREQQPGVFHFGNQRPKCVAPVADLVLLRGRKLRHRLSEGGDEEERVVPEAV